MVSFLRTADHGTNCTSYLAKGTSWDAEPELTDTIAKLPVAQVAFLKILVFAEDVRQNGRPQKEGNVAKYALITNTKT